MKFVKKVLVFMLRLALMVVSGLLREVGARERRLNSLEKRRLSRFKKQYW